MQKRYATMNVFMYRSPTATWLQVSGILVKKKNERKIKGGVVSLGYTWY